MKNECKIEMTLTYEIGEACIFESDVIATVEYESDVDSIFWWEVTNFRREELRYHPARVIATADIGPSHQLFRILRGCVDHERIMEKCWADYRENFMTDKQRAAEQRAEDRRNEI